MADPIKNTAPAPVVDIFAAPEAIGDTKSHRLASPHNLTVDVDPAYAGEYELTIGTFRIGDEVLRGRQYRPETTKVNGQDVTKEVLAQDGAKLRLGAIDAFRMLSAGVVKRIDGKRPDRIEQTVAA
jgi:hypothetical protein